jgi:DNA topoisomerase-1
MARGLPEPGAMRQVRAARRKPLTEPIVDPFEAARAAGLRYLNDAAPGIRRKRAGKGFSYVGLDGKPIRDPDELRRIKSLAIPPAWTDVWICPSPRGHLQATGRDARGRKQYRYHPRWREARDETKYERMIAFGQALPRIRERVERDLALADLPREKVLATVVRLLDTTSIRVGNEEYARQNGSFGLTTLRNRHVDVSGSTLRFHFRGKSGKEYRVDVKDRRLARIVQRCQDLPGQDLFQYLDDNGELQAVESNDVNEYLREIGGQEFTAKDFRTWAGTVLAACALEDFEAFESEMAAKRNVVQAIDAVAEQLGNTRAVCRKCYVHPAVIDAYLDRSLIDALKRGVQEASASRLGPEEAALLALLQQHQEREAQAARQQAAERKTA